MHVVLSRIIAYTLHVVKDNLEVTMFGKRLREVRMERKLTQQKLADAVGIALRTYQCYEQGVREPSLDMLVKLGIEPATLPSGIH